MSFILPYKQQRSSTSSLGNPSPLEEIERASTPGAASGYSGPRTPTPPTAPPPLVPTTSAERRPSRSRSPQGSTPAATAQRSTKRRPQSTDLGEQLISLLQEPPATHMPDSPLEESYYFALSLVPLLQRLDIDRKHRAKIAILNTFHSLERESTQPQEHWQPIFHPPTSQHSTHTSRPVALRPTAPQPPQAQSTGPFTKLFSNSGSAWQDGSQSSGKLWELHLDGVLFQQYFRMSKDAFDELLGKVGPLIAKADTRMRLSIGPAERLAICLRYLATGDSYRTIAFSYRVGHATVAVIVKEVAGAIWTALVEETMPVPQTEDWRAIAAGFQERWNFPNCVGAIDGKHVVIQAPAWLLAVVDAQYLFRVVDVGGFGRSSDGGSLRNSAFGEGLRDGSLQLPPDTVIPGAERLGLLPHVFVGDEAVPLLDNLLRPFTRERRLFNYRLSRARKEQQ
ncbi:uncharacterized protein LOC117545744 [Gymnodraco acuticeps]|uniref:Uncharacterized protein LOC117545744 n=1 Tax=Gymnodraco acuticeps TaxID=8218 RepID=A0A6P8U474_GYMAC|nr:uncharacterized protein LOC117545744 [Gymnodraco acuticeps]